MNNSGLKGHSFFFCYCYLQLYSLTFVGEIGEEEFLVLKLS